MVEETTITYRCPKCNFERPYNWHEKKYKYHVTKDGERYYDTPIKVTWKKVHDKEEREFVQPTKKEMEILRLAVAPDLKNCHYCKKKIHFEDEHYSIFNKPTRLICSSILCLTEAITEDEE